VTLTLLKYNKVSGTQIEKDNSPSWNGTAVS
jgi:hypothetical protein